MIGPRLLRRLTAEPEAPASQAGSPRGTWYGRALVALTAVFIVLPLVWLAYSAFLPREALFSGASVPTGFTLANFLSLPYAELIRPLILSIVVSTAVAFGQLILSLPAAYSLRSGAPLLGVFLLLLSIPAELLLIPMYSLLKDLSLIDNPLALVLPFLASPFAVFLLYGGLLRLPWAYVEAARLDGASELTIMRRVIAPLLRPELTAAGVLGFAGHWNLVLYPRVIMNDQRWWTVQVALNELLRQKPNEWGVLGAAAIVTSLPIVALYLMFESRVT
ncbi:MAG TPA: carbohydrate ABC transporter permease, partial [Deinococcales bacterium]|nr:carbohydrate ABC transporter permease [Deinococcales bacterium]